MSETALLQAPTGRCAPIPAASRRAQTTGRCAQIPAQIFPAGTAKMQLLSSINPIEKKEEARTPDVRENADLKAILDAFEKAADPYICREAYHLHESYVLNDMLKAYRKMLELVQGLRHGESDIQLFMLSMLGRQGDMPYSFGLFLSALINTMKEDSITINMAPFWEAYGQGQEDRLSCIGFSNCKNVLILGDAGFGSGAYAQAGALKISGSVGHACAAHMQGGSVEFDGGFLNAQLPKSASIGAGQWGGSLIVRNFGFYNGSKFSARNLSYLCSHASGGELHLFNDALPPSYKQPYKHLAARCKEKEITGVAVYLNETLVYKGEPYRPHNSYSGGGATFATF